MVSWYETFEDREWMTQQDAAEAFRCSVQTIRKIAQEMVQLEMDGIWVSNGRIRMVDKKAISEYLYKRNKIRTDKRLGRK